MSRQRGSFWLALAVTLVAASAVGVSIWIHPPSAHRADHLDQRRGRDLQRLAGEITAYWRSQQKLPPDMAALVQHQTVDPNILRDPDTGEAYRYRVLGNTSYQLCASITHPAWLQERNNWTRMTDDSGQSQACFKPFPIQQRL